MLSLFDIVVCNNYPDHSTEGFKSFISVESCKQPSYLSATGVPVFGNGCTFHYICDIGYQPMTGISVNGASMRNMPVIKCSNGIWSARAICIKKEFINNNVFNFKMKNAQQKPQINNRFMPNIAQQNLANIVDMNRVNLMKRTAQNVFDKEQSLNSKVLSRFRRSLDETDKVDETSEADESSDNFEENKNTYLEEDDNDNNEFNSSKGIYGRKKISFNLKLIHYFFQEKIFQKQVLKIFRVPLQQMNKSTLIQPLNLIQ